MISEPAPLHWLREFGRPPRILGLDVARGLAILGMAGAHIGETKDFDWADATTWSGIVHGNPSILFAVLAGVSIALMTGRAALPERERLPEIRLRLIGRGAVIFLIGLALEVLNTPIAIILTLYGLLYVAVIPFLRWRPWQLLTAAGVLAVVAPALLAFLDAVTLHPSGAGIGFVFYGSYPITVWMALVLAGMALGRSHVGQVHTAVVALVAGIALAVGGYALSAMGQLAGVSGSPDRSGNVESAPSGWADYPDALAETDPRGAAIRGLFAVEPHSGGTAEVLGSGGFAVTVIALCLLLSRPLRWPLLPLSALGSMPLTAYSAHVVSIVLVVGPGGFFSSNEFWGLTALGLLAATTLWSMFIGRGPLERLVGWVSTQMAAVPRR